jgi:predicted PurR-regulated permease PerM
MYSRRTTLWFLGITLLIVVGCALVITRPFLYPIASAIILAVVFYPAHERILRWTKGKPGSASLLSTLALLFLFCVPVLIILTVAANEAVSAAQYLTRKSAAEGGFTGFVTIMAERVLLLVGRWVDVSKFNIRGAINSHVQQAGVWILGSGATILSGFARFTVNSIITLVIVFFLFRDGKHWVARTTESLPLSPEQTRRLLANISETIVANVYGVLSVGIAQGILTGIAVAIVGMPSPLLLGLGAGFASVVPVVGASLVWLPCGLYLLFVGATWKGVFILCWGVFVISAADNIIRPWVVSGKVELHPLVLLFFILGGVEAFGFLGLFFGPVIASVLVVLFEMFRDELSHDTGGSRAVEVDSLSD